MSQGHLAIGWVQLWVQRWVQSSSPHAPLAGAQGLPYVVMRGAAQLPYYKRRVPAELRAVLGRSTFTARLSGAPGSREFRRAYDLIHGQAEAALAGAEALPRLTPQEQLGVAGRWAALATPQTKETGFGATEAQAVLLALDELQIVLPFPIGEEWQAPQLEGKEADLVEVVQRMARRIEAIPHPCFWHQPGEVLHSDDLPPQQALAHLEGTVSECRQAITSWIKEARKQLKALGLTVAAAEVQAVALRLVTTAVHLANQVAEIEAGRMPDPLPAFPPPPVRNGSLGGGGRPTFEVALERWVRLRRPAQKSQLDAAARLQELAQHTGHNRLEQLTPAEVAGWRDALLEWGAASTAKRKLAMVRAVLGTAAGDGVTLQGGVLERLAGRGLRDATGTRRERRPFTEAEAATLWHVSRQQGGGRALDRWAFPLGLALGARLEELAALRREDVGQVDGLWVLAIQPTTDRLLKNDSSARLLPMPEALVAEGFADWVLQQGPDLLFPEPPAPATDPRLSHYASVRLGKLLRAQGIADRAAVFHSSRHFTAQQLVDAGAEQRVIEQILGHTSRSMTARYSRGGVPLPLLAEAMEQRSWGWVPGPMG